jgi:hypothetical protein
VNALPAVRAEVIDELARVYVDRKVDPGAEAAWSSRVRWSTGDERKAAFVLMLDMAEVERTVILDTRAELQAELDRLTGGAP